MEDNDSKQEILPDEDVAFGNKRKTNRAAMSENHQDQDESLKRVRRTIKISSANRSISSYFAKR